MSPLEIDCVAYQSFPERGYFAAAYYLKPPRSADAVVDIKTVGGALVRRFICPAYKIWNIAAHLPEIVDEIDGLAEVRDARTGELAGED